MPYLMGGFPDLDTSRAVATAYVESGADLIELGVPYSDPLADGPVIHAAATEALRAGITLDDVLGVCGEIDPAVPVLPMIYTNMALSRGAERFAESLLVAGAAGVIIPDLPPGEDGELPAALTERGLALVPFASPTSRRDRLERSLGAARGFVYVVSLAGVTGERAAPPEELADLLDAVRAATPVPAAVGFGIGTPERAAEVGRIADGVIIGSRLVREVAESDSPGAAADAVRSFLVETRRRLQDTAGSPATSA